MSRVPEPSTLLDLTQDKVVVLDEDGTYRHVNASVSDLLGFEPDELVGTNAFALVHPDDKPALREAFSAIVRGDRDSTEPLEYRYETADGDYLWLRTEVHTPAETELDAYVLFSRDVTREVESQRRLETIAAASDDVFWMFSADWRELLFVNEAIEDVFGVSKGDLECRPTMFLEAIHPDDRQYVERAMRRLSAGKSTHLDFRIGTPDGPTKWVRAPGEPVTEDGDVAAVAGFARDVTDEYRRKRQLTVMDNLLRHTIRNHMNIVDGTAERIVDDLADVDGPVAADDAVGAGGSADAGSPSADDCVEHAKTIRRVADDLLTTAEKQRDVIELLRQRGSPQPVDVEPIVEEAVATATDRVCDAAEVSVSCPSGVRAFMHVELDDAIAELVDNAIEHAESPPDVRVTVTSDGGAVEISVRDNCPPIPREERHVMTDRWEMDELCHTDGMGLWLVYWIVDRSGGDLTFDTHDDGNVVTIAVPRADRDEAVERRVGADRPTRDQTATGTGAGGTGGDGTDGHDESVVETD